MDPTFTVLGTLREAWKLTTGAKWAICAPLFFSLIFLYALFFILTKIAIPIPFVNTIFLFCFTAFWISGVVAGVIKIAIERARKNSISAKMGFQYFSGAIPSVLIAAIIFLPLLLSGSMFFMNFSEGSISPAVSMISSTLYYSQFFYSPVAFALLYLAMPFMVDKKISVFSAISLSVRTTKRHVFKIICLEIIGILLFCGASIPWYLSNFIPFYPAFFNLLGYILKCIVLFWLVLFQFLVMGVVYHTLVD